MDNGPQLYRPIARTYSAPPNYGCSYKFKSSGSISYAVSKDCDSSIDMNKSKEENDIKHNSPKWTLIRRVDDGKHLHRPIARTYSAPPDYVCPYKFKSSGSISYAVSRDCDSPFDLNISKEGNDIGHNSPKGILNRRIGTISLSKIQFFYYKANNFQHFEYVYKLTRDCKISNFRGIHCNSIDTSPMPKDVILEIGIVGDFTEENLKFITKSKGKRKPPKNHTVWKVTPLLCFQNDLDKESTIELLRGQGTLENTRIKSASICRETDEITDSLIFVDKNKEDNIRAITSCLEKPIHQMLQNWSTYLETKGLGKHTSRVIDEIKAIGKQLVLEESKRTTAVSDTPCMKCKSIVPGDIKNYLFGRPDVNAFGIWSNSLFKIFVKNTTDEIELKNELIKRYRYFFDNYPLDVEIGKFIEYRTLKQGDPIFVSNSSEKLPTGTLGGFVLKENEERKKYALTCNHVFPNRNQIAYADGSDGGDRRQIGSCVFTKSDLSCDFAAIEMNDTILNECDVTFRRDDGKDINARVYDETLENVGFVHKIGATTDVTQGYIQSPEFYNKYATEGNRERIFLVKGTDGQFSEEGDSGSLVFSRPRSVQQNYVDIVGMVYAKNRKAKDDDEIEVYNRTDEESENLLGNQNISTEVKNEHENNQQNLTTSTSTSSDDELSCCYRLHTALELFKQDQGPDFDVKFKDDLPSSPLSTSLSSGSDVEAV